MMRYVMRGFAGLALALLCACSTSPKVSFYALDEGNPVELPGTNAAYSIVIGPVSVPEMIDRPQFVTRTGKNQVAIVESVRWAEPLRSSIPRVIAGNLVRLLDGASVSVYPLNRNADADLRISLDVLRFDSIPGDSASVEIVWTTRSANGAFRKSGRSSARESAADGYEALVAAHDRALARVSRDIAEAIRAAPQDAK